MDAALEARGIKVQLGTLKEAEALTPEYSVTVVSYISGAKSSIVGLNGRCRDLRRSIFWRHTGILCI